MIIKNSFSILLLSMALLLNVTSCVSDIKNELSSDTVDYTNLDLPDRPNIVWIVAEDLSAYIPSYGDSTVQTPNIDRLVREGVRYTHMYSPSGVCAPSRAAIATGMYPTRTGAMHMRTGPWYSSNNVERALKNYPRNAYEAIPPEGTHMLSTYLRQAGYYCSNNAKEDYQFLKELTAWDDSSNQAHYKNRKPGQPFYSIFNIGVTHESQIWRKADDTLLVDENLEVPVEPYLPDTEIAKRDIRRMYSNIVAMDHRVGEILKELEEANLMDSTIIFWYTDHGGPLPRQKRTVYHSGLHVPLVVRFPHQQLAGSTDDQLLSFIDFKPTMLSLAGIQPPDYVDGKAWLGDFMEDDEREYLFAAADRFDNETDKIRAAFDDRYKLIRYYHQDQPYYLPVKYRETMPIMKELLRLRDEGNLTPKQALWFRPTKDSIEFFDTWNDPDELNNLANEESMQEEIEVLRQQMDAWIARTNDLGIMPEEKFLSQLWPDGRQPVTADPEISLDGSKISITSETPSASIGYQWVENEEELSDAWRIYQAEISPQEGKMLFVRAHRIGYRPSQLVSMDF